MDTWIVVASTPAGPAFYGKDVGPTGDPVAASRMNGTKANTLAGRIIRVSAERAQRTGRPMNISNVRAIDLAARKAMMEEYYRSNPSDVGGWIGEHPWMTFFLALAALNVLGWAVSGGRY